MSNKFSIVLTSSVKGEIDRRTASSRIEAFALAQRMLGDRADDEVGHNPAAMHGEVISIRIESDDG
jgi:hypothetical protein